MFSRARYTLNLAPDLAGFSPSGPSEYEEQVHGFVIETVGLDPPWMDSKGDHEPVEPLVLVGNGHHRYASSNAAASPFVSHEGDVGQSE